MSIRQTCAEAQILTTLPFTNSFDTTGALNETSVTPSCGDRNKVQWFRYTNLGDSRRTVIDTAGTDYYNDISIWTGTCGTLTQFACSDDTPDASNKGCQLAFKAIQGVVYYIMIADNDAGLGGNLELNVYETPGLINNIITYAATDDLVHGLFAFDVDDPSTWIVYEIGESGQIEGFLAQRIIEDEENHHIFMFSNRNLVYEYDDELNLIQIFGAPGNASGNLKPSSADWNNQFIQFVNGFLYLGWRGGASGPNQPNVAIQKRDQLTYALLDQWIFAHGAASVTPHMWGVNSDGTYGFYNVTGGGGGSDNKIYKRNLAGASTTLIATYKTMATGSNPSGYSISLMSITPDDNLICYINKLTAGIVTQDAIASYDINGNLLWDHDPSGFYTTNQPAEQLAVNPSGTLFYLAPLNGFGGALITWFLVSDGTIVDSIPQLTSPRDYGLLITEDLTPPSPGVTDMNLDTSGAGCDANKNIIITGTDFPDNPTVTLTRDGVEIVNEVISASSTEIIIHVPDFINGTYCVEVVSGLVLLTSDDSPIYTSDGSQILVS